MPKPHPHSITPNSTLTTTTSTQLTVTLHPYVNAEFALKWRFKNAHMPRVGLLERVKRGRSSQGDTATLNGDEEGERRDSTSTGVESIEDRELGYASTLTSTSGSASTSGTGTSTHASVITPDGFLSVPSSSLSSTPRPPPRPPIAPIIQASSSSSSSSSHNTPSFYSTPLASLSRATISLPPAPSPFPSLPTAYIPTQSKGGTPFLPLKEHSISWNLNLDTVLKMDVDRDTHQLQPSPFKLVVMQKEDEGGPRVQNPRLGAVYLNLAEYVDKGTVERRYLLRESKTNATLKLSIVMTPLSSPTHPIPTYIAPTLPKGEILTGIASFLESDAYKRFQRPRELELYGPYRDQEELEIDLMGGLRNSDYTSCEDDDEDEDEDEDEGEGEGEEERDYEVPFDPARLPIAYGIKTTETLIDALFNPEVVYDPKDECPFTRFVDPIIFPPKPKKRKRKKGSAYSGSTESSLSSQAGKEEKRPGGGVKAWFRRIGGSSRPGTPTSETFGCVSEEGVLLLRDKPKEEGRKNGHSLNNSLSHGLGFVLAPGAGGGSVGGVGALGIGGGRPSTPVHVLSAQRSIKRPATPRMDASKRGPVAVSIRG
ncbi:hypothetical protein BDQ17DRAFT_1344650 [Cyathus striatus]|nr:hypothetical protein BDQ17DRAFT_1344650 [Cyathus striatus]